MSPSPSVAPAAPAPRVDLSRYLPAARAAAIPALDGWLSEAVGLVLEARGVRASIGDLYQLRPPGQAPIEAEVVGVRGDRTLMMPLGATQGLEVGTPVRRVGRAARAEVGPGLLGRVVDGLGRPLDGGPLPMLDAERPLHGAPPSPLLRRPIDAQLPTGVRALDGMLSLAEGQRIGIFAGGGVGKSTLLGMLIRRMRADVAVVALIGERGREVEEFVNRTLGREGMQRAVVVAATSAEPPLVRARGALYATAVAEHFRDQGLRVLLLMDSVTRYAMALREIGLAVGEPPTTKGYTPSVFAALPRLLERAGTSTGEGSITGLYTVLVEGDDLSDPIADAARAILDGHVVLSRKLAERGHFPAIDVPRSVSRCMTSVVDPAHVELAQRARGLLAAHAEAEDLVAIGAYQAGSVPRLDEALARMPALERFLVQPFEEQSDPAAVQAELRAIWEDPT
ncbi:MAG TPA: FliI/YscN family ATPase [Sandaracinaceae bacterium LLY-WYZ-13_1]|nr:FliI/YscN family ATPase [Sandaracinaceae bacterium LLY-WYZ-13_1]